MTRPLATPTERIEPVEERNTGFSTQIIPDAILRAQDLRHGLDTASSREQVPPSGARVLDNARDRRDFFGRRPGHSNYGTLTNLGGRPVMKLYGAKLTGDKNILVKYSVEAGAGSIRTLDNTSLAFGVTWNILTGDVYDQFNRVSVAQFIDDVFSATLERKILRQELTTLISEEVEQAPVAKVITNFADRIVAAHIRDPAFGLNPTLIQWSANGDPFIWDAAIDESAGRVDLTDSASDTGDEIAGLFSVGQNLVVVLRERTIWHITRQPFGSAPFRFTAIITDVGCDMPYSAVRVPGGIVFADTRTNGVYFYSPGAQPRRLNTRVENVIFADIEHRDTCEGIWDPIEREYQLSISDDEDDRTLSLTRFIFNFDTQGWTKDIGPLITAMAAIRDVGSAVTIDELVGSFDAQVGTFDGLGGRGSTGQVIVKSRADNASVDRVVFEDVDFAFDPTDQGTPTRFVFDYEPPEISGVESRRTLKELNFIFDLPDDLEFPIPPAVPNPRLEILTSSNNQPFVIKKTLADLVAESRRKAGIKQQTTGDAVSFKIRSTYKNFSLREWWAKVLEKGVKKVDTVQS